MSQSSVIAFYLLAGFVVYVIMSGHLAQYASILGLGGTSGSSAVSSVGSVSVPVSVNASAPLGVFP